MLRHALISILLLATSTLFADDDIYVAKDEDQYSSADDESFFDGNFENFVLQINIASYHPGVSEDYNEFNRGIGIEYHLDSLFS